jgi:hypothetical protein
MASLVGISPLDIIETINFIRRSVKALCGDHTTKEREELQQHLNAVCDVLEATQDTISYSGHGVSLEKAVGPHIKSMRRILSKFKMQMEKKHTALSNSKSQEGRSFKRKCSNGRGALTWEFYMKKEAAGLISKLGGYLQIIHILIQLWHNQLALSFILYVFG